MRIFILEDDPLRMLWFREFFLGADITHAESCTQVDRFQPPYDVIFFDHDLGGRQMDAHEDCGATFARLIADRIVGPPGGRGCEIVIHSYNGDGAQNIRGIVGGYVAPFRGQWFNRICDELRRQ